MLYRHSIRPLMLLLPRPRIPMYMYFHPLFRIDVYSLLLRIIVECAEFSGAICAKVTKRSPAFRTPSDCRWADDVYQLSIRTLLAGTLCGVGR